MVTDRLTFTACVHIEHGVWRVAIREQYRGRCEFIVRSDIAPPISQDGFLDEVWDAVDDAGWFVDRTSTRRDPELFQTVAGVIPRIPHEATLSRDQDVFMSRCLARGVPFSIAARGWNNGETCPVTFSEFYVWETALGDTVHEVA